MAETATRRNPMQMQMVAPNRVLTTTVSAVVLNKDAAAAALAVDPNASPSPSASPSASPSGSPGAVADGEKKA